jgi:flagellar biosynthetic protein FlhB
MAEQQLQERTLPATPRRREQARERGDIAKSRELISASIILAGALIILWMGDTLVGWLIDSVSFSWSHLSMAPMTQKGLSDLMNNTIVDALQVVIPLVGFFAVVGVVASIGHYGFVWSDQALTLDWNRINPFDGFGRLFTLTSLFELAKTLIKFLVIGWVVYKVVEHDIPEIITTLQMHPAAILTQLSDKLVRLLLYSGLVMAVLGILDYGYQWWDHERKLRMTPQEMKEEMRQTEGDPFIRARIRSIQREMARKRMMSEVPKATVVITNPTHLAVALRYEPDKMAAPRVVAKGADYIAEVIRELADQHGILRVENKPLAQTLYKTVDVGQDIPSHLYRAVAEILVYVYKLKGGYQGAVGTPTAGRTPPAGRTPTAVRT